MAALMADTTLGDVTASREKLPVRVTVTVTRARVEGSWVGVPAKVRVGVGG
jgi:hypothetical protein